MMLRQMYRGLHLVASQPRQVRLMHSIARMQQQMITRQIAMVSVQQVGLNTINFLHWLWINREDSAERKRKARRPMTSHLSTRKILLQKKKLYMSQNLHQLFKKKSQTFQLLMQVNQLKMLPQISSVPFLLEASIRLTPLQATSLQLLRTLSKEDMLAFSSAQHLSKSLFMMFMRILCTWKVSTTILRPSTCSPRTPVLASGKLPNSTKHFRLWPLSTRWPLSSLKSWQKIRDFLSLVKLPEGIRSCTNC